MASRYSAARPKRAGELFARHRHGQIDGSEGGSADGDETAGGGPAKKVKFDVRNPSNLAPDAREEDEVLDADVIGRGGSTTKRGAVNVDGYDSDSDNETFHARAARRGDAREGRKAKTGTAKDDGAVNVDLIDQLDNYDKRLKGRDDGAPAADNDDDMFADNDGGDEKAADPASAVGGADAAGRKTWKEVRFLGADAILGQEDTSRSGGHVRLDAGKRAEEEEEEDDDDDDDDDEDEEAALLEAPIDEEVGVGGLKKHAPKLDAFNMKQEQEEGGFDQAGNYIRKAADPDAQHDRWLEGLSKKEMKRAAAAHAQREAALRQQRRADDGLATADLFAALLRRLARGETPLEALARLGQAVGPKKPRSKRVPKWRLQKAAGQDGMDVDEAQPEAKPEDTPAQAQAKQDIDAITDAADHLLNREFPDIYDTEWERLAREYRAETGEQWAEPPPPAAADEPTKSAHSTQWEYRWVDGRGGDGAVQGPFDGPTMQAWQDAGYFSEGVEFRLSGNDGSWRRVVSFG